MSWTGQDPAAAIVLGGRFGEEDRALSFQRLDAFAESGGRYVDTAHSYADGRSEEVIGAWLRANRDQLSVVSKIGHPPDGRAPDLSADALRAEAALSCRRLGVDSLDGLLLHRDDAKRPVAELVSVLLGLVSAGLARRVGVSNFPVTRLKAVTDLLIAAGERPLTSYQYSLAVPTRPLWPGSCHADDGILAVVREASLPMLAWAGQARGFFAGATEPIDGTDPFASPRNQVLRDHCRAIAADLGSRPETVALAWTVRQPLTWPVVGARTLEELRSSMDAASLVLSPEHSALLDEARRPLARAGRRRAEEPA